MLNCWIYDLKARKSENFRAVYTVVHFWDRYSLDSDEIISPSKEDSGVGWAGVMGGASSGDRRHPGLRLSSRTARAWLLYKQQARATRHSFNLKLAHNNGIQGNIIDRDPFMDKANHQTNKISLS